MFANTEVGLVKRSSVRKKKGEIMTPGRTRKKIKPPTPTPDCETKDNFSESVAKKKSEDSLLAGSLPADFTKKTLGDGLPPGYAKNKL